MSSRLTEQEAVAYLKDAFNEVGCEIELDDFDNSILLTITGCSTVQIDRKRFSKRKRLEETVALLKRSLAES
ncbi:hypothetical protein [Acinetobacter baumannii]|uniref:Uncharacterized protein n=1 Tax=Acinetobacter baumannii TaxID=470 RepID=A0ABD5D8X9_ACIBA|nr:hypothetical protein [Acinetobacter baumannii]EHU2760851.1 hypothetical protein [Acinetobacter baumannii]EHU3119802.1 hypothetical protein [Acinetobacter baumannii]EJB8490020.1 hypothetical protein [Acinetobacter baumannii]EKV7389819.1 hypothetical protein [Acinetobacter baumannii]EKW3202873.1 hypothetical protein [Acinetobacter baumannii]